MGTPRTQFIPSLPYWGNNWTRDTMWSCIQIETQTKKISAFFRTRWTSLVHLPKWKTHCAVPSLLGLTTDPSTQLNTQISTPKPLKHRLQSAGIIYSWDISLLNGQTYTLHLNPYQEQCAKHTCAGGRHGGSISLQWFLALWEACNNNVHSHTESKQNTRLKAQHQITACPFMEQQPLVRPSDQWIFPDNPDTFLETATGNRLGTWIASRRKAIKNSADMAEKESSRGTANITSFFTPTNLDSVAWMWQWHQDKLIHDADYKKRRQKLQPTSRSAQPLITGYLTLSGQ